MPISLKIQQDVEERVITLELKAKKSLDGNIMIFDHEEMDIVVMPAKSKIVTFAKNDFSELVYNAQSRLFEFLKRKGIVQFDSIQGGNVYGSLEGLLLESKDKEKIDVLDYVLFQISEWIKAERPYFESIEAHDEMMDDHFTDPEDENATELGEIPHEDEKGSIIQRGLFAPYLYGRYTY